MNRQTKVGRVLGILVGVVTLTVVAVFALVQNQTDAPQYAAAPSLENIVKSAQTWDTSFTSWIGRQAPDLTLEDIEGRKHTLTDYRGRDVLVVFWATWCPACNLEIPHLIELRKAFSEDELAILAISNEPPEHLRHFAEARGVNYAVASLGRTTLPAPFADVTSIPTTFFIDRRGTIKLAALGSVSFEEAKAILRAGK